LVCWRTKQGLIKTRMTLFQNLRDR